MIDGKYKVSASALGKKVEGVLTLKADGNKLSGTLNAAGRTFAFDNGTLKDNTFTIPVEYKKKKVTVTGTVSEDGSISGKGKAGLLSASYSGKRM